MAADPPQFGPNDAVELRALVPGAVIRRWTEPAGRQDPDTWEKPKKVHIPAPCCGRLFRDVPTSYANTTVPWAMCCVCQRLYRLEVIDADDGGFDAVFMVEPDIELLLVASHRKPVRR